MSSSHNEMIESQILEERKTRNVQASKERWLSVKSEAFKLYMQEDMQLEEVMARIEISHGFTASLRMWKLKLKEWGYKKNMSPNTMRWVVSKEGKRDHENKDTDFFFNGIEIKKERIENFKRRRIGEEPISAETPPDITYGTPCHNDSEEMGNYYADSLQCVLSSISISRGDAGHGSKDSSDVKTQRNDTSNLQSDEGPVISMVARYLDPDEPDYWSTENSRFSDMKDLDDFDVILDSVSPPPSSSGFAVVTALDSASIIDEDVFCDKLYLGNLVKYEDYAIGTLEQEFKLSKVDKEGGRRCLRVVDEEGPQVIAQAFLSTVYLHTSRPRTATSSFFLALTDFILEFDSSTSESNDIRLGIIQDVFTMFASCNTSKWAGFSSCMRQMTDTIIEAVADGDAKKSFPRLFIHGFSFARELSVFVDVVEIAEEMYESLLKHSSTINVDLYGIALAKAYREYGILLKRRSLWPDYCEQLLLACDFALYSKPYEDQLIKTLERDLDSILSRGITGSDGTGIVRRANEVLKNLRQDPALLHKIVEGGAASRIGTVMTLKELLDPIPSLEFQDSTVLTSTASKSASLSHKHGLVTYPDSDMTGISNSVFMVPY